MNARRYPLPMSEVKGNSAPVTGASGAFGMVAAHVPKGPLSEPGDLAGSLLFLVSKASDFHTGHIRYADGGYTAG